MVELQWYVNSRPPQQDGDRFCEQNSRRSGSPGVRVCTTSSRVPLHLSYAKKTAIAASTRLTTKRRGLQWKGNEGGKEKVSEKSK